MQLIKDGISTASLWYTIGAEPMNCDIVLEAIAGRIEQELAMKKRKADGKKDQWKMLKADVDKIRAKGNSPSKWNQGDLKKMLRYKMHGKGHSKFTEHADILAQYERVKDAESDDELDSSVPAAPLAIEG